VTNSPQLVDVQDTRAAGQLEVVLSAEMEE